MKGYVHPLYVLPFDHRSTFAKSLLNLDYPIKKAADKKQVTLYKKIVFDAFKVVCSKYIHKERLAILVDEEFGSDIIKAAKRLGVATAVPVEKSGQNVFAFEYGKKFGEHLLKFKAPMAKALVRYNPENRVDNEQQRIRLKILNEFCEKNNILFILELLIPPTPAQLKKVKNNKDKFDTKVRPSLAIMAINELQASGIEPDIWKLEAPDTKRDWKYLIKAIRKQRQHRNTGIIVLGRGEDEKKVNRWLQLAAKVGAINGFAVGRTVWMKPLEVYHAKKISRTEAVNRIAENYLRLIELWDTESRL